MALFHTANQRPTPIPVYAEMSAVNPVFVLPGALGDAKALAEGFFGSVTGSAGQLCTKPGLLFLPEGDRKSTRLNSSHVSISYAVFCLKKKNKVITYE